MIDDVTDIWKGKKCYHRKEGKGQKSLIYESLRVKERGMLHMLDLTVDPKTSEVMFR